MSMKTIETNFGTLFSTADVNEEMIIFDSEQQPMSIVKTTADIINKLYSCKSVEEMINLLSLKVLLHTADVKEASAFAEEMELIKTEDMEKMLKRNNSYSSSVDYLLSLHPLVNKVGSYYIFR